MENIRLAMREFRMLLVELLISMALTIAPTGHPHSILFAKYMGKYFKEIQS